jgi:hypothetical protein
MNAKTIKIVYWVLTVIFALAMLGDSYGGITKQESGRRLCGTLVPHLYYSDNRRV